MPAVHTRANGSAQQAIREHLAPQTPQARGLLRLSSPRLPPHHITPAMAPAARVAALLLLLGVSYAAKVDPSRPTLMQLRDRWHKESSAPGKVSTASEHEEPHYGHELQEMEVCLVEVSRKACSSAGTVTAGPPVVRDQRKLWTSEVACCNDGYGEQSYSSHYGAGLGDRLTALPSIGSCDWSAMLLTGDLISTGISRIGKASAVCYFSGDALSCGGPMCDKLVISLEGSVYTADTAYSHYPTANVNNADCQADDGGFWAGGRVAGPGAWMFNTGADGAAKVPGARAAEAQQAAGANLENYGYGHDSYGRDDGYGDSYGSKRAVYSGSATIINGIITAFAGQRKEKWDEGVFEYTPSFTGGTTPYTGAINAAFPWVRDNTYKLTLYKHGSY